MVGLYPKVCVFNYKIILILKSLNSYSVVLLRKGLLFIELCLGLVKVMLTAHVRTLFNVLYKWLTFIWLNMWFSNKYSHLMGSF